MNRLVRAAKLIDGERVLTLAPSTQWRVQHLDLGMPDVREVVEDRPLYDGTLDETRFHGARLVTLAGKAVGDADSAPGSLLDELARFCHLGRRPWLVYRLDGQGERRILLRGDRRSAPLEVGTGGIVKWQASWRAPRGVQESDTLHEATANPSEGEPGRVYDLTFARSYPASAGAGALSIANAGNTSADAVLRIFGPCTGPRVENRDAGGRLEFTAAGGLTIADGDYAEVDLAERTATLNGDPGTSLLRYLEYADPARSSWWRLAPGSNLVRFYPHSATPPSSMQIFWRDTWL